MRTSQLFLRCFAEKKGDLWQAFCVDLNLAAQGTTSEEVQQKLHSQIAEYVFDAMAGQDQEYSVQLLKRKAPTSIMAKYHYCRVKVKAGQLHDGVRDGVCRIFEERIPLVPKVA